MSVNLEENEQYEVSGVCNECQKKFGIRVLKKDVGAVKCGLCESSNITVFSIDPVRQILME